MELYLIFQYLQSIQIKVIRKKYSNTFPVGSKSTYLVKDHQGNKGSLDLWNANQDKVVVGQAFNISNVKVCFLFVFKWQIPKHKDSV